MHKEQACQQLTGTEQADESVLEAEEKPKNPFAALESLKKH
jgi:uncharacterized metal-binding protein YceD (DUF177 family)